MTDTSLGTVFIVAAPSGGGKTSLVKQLINSLSHIEVSVSHTTSPKRPRELDGVDYFFINETEFMTMVEAQAFIEHAHVFNYYYGTSVHQIKSRIEQGIDVVLDIDWQGARQIKALFPSAVSVFIIPPSLEILTQRLQSRRQDDATIIANRMQAAQDEMTHFEEFDYLIINDDFIEASHELQSIVVANRQKVTRQKARFGKLLSFLVTSQ